MHKWYQTIPETVKITFLASLKGAETLKGLNIAETIML